MTPSRWHLHPDVAAVWREDRACLTHVGGSASPQLVHGLPEVFWESLVTGATAEELAVAVMATTAEMDGLLADLADLGLLRRVGPGAEDEQ